MRKILSLLFLISFLVLSAVGLASAASHEEPPDLPVIETLNRIVNWLFAFLLIAAVIAVIIAGFYFVTSTGDPERIKTARISVLYAIVGVIVALLARGLVVFINTVLR